MEWLCGILGKQWNIEPAGGATGEAYVGMYKDKRVFLKRNSSPFLAVLSVEGIVPKLLWTKRLENGDVITAQEYLDGHKLTRAEMKSEELALFLKKIHTSDELLRMLRKIRKEVELPNLLLEKIQRQLSPEVREKDLVRRAICYLTREIPEVPETDLVVCHSDLSHHNCLKDESGKIYLVDWDDAVIADVAKDIGILLYHYVPKDEWDHWLGMYDLKRTPELESRFKWYTLIHALIYLELNKNRTELPKWTKLIEGILS